MGGGGGVCLRACFLYKEDHVGWGPVYFVCCWSSWDFPLRTLSQVDGGKPASAEHATHWMHACLWVCVSVYEWMSVHVCVCFVLGRELGVCLYRSSSSMDSCVSNWLQWVSDWFPWTTFDTIDVIVCHNHWLGHVGCLFTSGEWKKDGLWWRYFGHTCQPSVWRHW